MKKVNGQHIAIFIGAIAVVFLVIWLFPPNRGVNWMETYKRTSQHPYGTYLIYELLESSIGDKEFKEVDKPLEMAIDDARLELEGNTNYIFIGDVPYISQDGQKKLLEFVKEGNTAFFASGELPSFIREEGFPGLNEDSLDVYNYQYDSAVQLGFYHPDFSDSLYDLFYIVDFETYHYYWSYLEDEGPGISAFEGNSFTRLGHMDGGNLVFFRLQFGEGQFIFHTIPMAFTNYFLREAEWLDYAEKAFAHLPEGNILWDETSKVYTYSRSGEVNFSRSPLEYILSQPSLRWSWYLLLVLVFFYIFFRSKRTQRIIPLVEPYINTSLEFVQVIGKLHFQQRNHKQLAEEKMKLFQADIRAKYRVPTKEIDESAIKNIALKARVDQKVVSNIFEAFKKIEKSKQIHPDTLKHFYLAIENFDRLSR